MIEIQNPINSNYCLIRKSLIPSLLEFFSKNTKKELPQLIFEVGDCVEKDLSRENRIRQTKKIAYAICKDKITFTDLKQVFESLSEFIGRKAKIEEYENPMFIEGRCGKIIFDGKEKGIIGEVNPSVLTNWGIEVPVAIFEFEFADLF